MVSSDFKKEAKERLKGKWGTAIGILFADILISIIIEYCARLFPETVKVIIDLVIAIINVPLLYGVINAYLKLYKGEEVHAFDFLDLGFSNFKRAWGVQWFKFLKMILPTIIVIILLFVLAIPLATFSLIGQNEPGSFAFKVSEMSMAAILTCIGFFAASIWLYAKSLYYVLAEYIAIDNPDITSKEAVQKSEELMKNNRGKYFFLNLSFIGWMILAAISFGIGLIWLIPYMNFSNLAFYMYLKEGSDQN